MKALNNFSFSLDLLLCFGGIAPKWRLLISDILGDFVGAHRAQSRMFLLRIDQRSHTPHPSNYPLTVTIFSHTVPRPRRINVVAALAVDSRSLHNDQSQLPELMAIQM